MSVVPSEIPWTHLPSWMTEEEAQEWNQKINNLVIWEQPLVKVYGKQYLVPRKTSFLSESNIKYTYSGLTHIGNGWPEWFLPLLKQVSIESDAKFNGCLINLYRDGKDRMGWHSDDEPEIDASKPITSLSFGTQRDFCLKHRFENFRESLPLANGDLLIMHPNCQKHWLHSIPIRKKVNQPRINITFRCYKNTYI